jgi:hypothetical protein
LEDRLARLLELTEGRVTSTKEDLAPYFLPHDRPHGETDALVAGEERASSFSRLHAAYLVLFRSLFPSVDSVAGEALARLEAVSSVRRDLVERRKYDVIDRPPWPESSVTESEIVREPKGYETDGLERYADLLCRDEAGRILLVVEFVAESDVEEALRFWSRSTEARCLVLLRTDDLRGYWNVYTRKCGEFSFSRSEIHHDLPRPRDFEVLSDVGDRSVDSMLASLRQGHPDFIPALVGEWQHCMGAITMPMRAPPWRPTKAKQILNGLAAIDDPDVGATILSRAAPRPWRHRDEGRLEGLMEGLTEEHLFAPLYWRLPVTAAISFMKLGRHPEGTLCVAGERLLAESIMGLQFDPLRHALDDATAFAARVPPSKGDVDEEDERPIRWSRPRSRDPRVELHEGEAPALVWEAFLREWPHWNHSRVSFLEAREKLEGMNRQDWKSDSTMRRWMSQRLEHRDLRMAGVLGDYDPERSLVILHTQSAKIVADLLGLAPRHVESVAFIHLSVLAMAHEARDLDGNPGFGFAVATSSKPFVCENPVQVVLAQYFAFKLIERLEDAYLLTAFEKLSDHQPALYRRWCSMRDVPLERMRLALLRARAAESAINLPTDARSE